MKGNTAERESVAGSAPATTPSPGSLSQAASGTDEAANIPIVETPGTSYAAASVMGEPSVIPPPSLLEEDSQPEVVQETA